LIRLKILGLLLLTLGSLPGATSQESSERRFGESIAKEALKHLGEPYVWGGRDLKRDGGYDCSGLTRVVFAAHGIQLAATAMQQYQGGIGIERPALEAGDLVFFLSSSAQTPMHVGIYLGGGRFVHAPGDGQRIKTESLDRSYFANRYVGARRYIPDFSPRNPDTKENAR
jgi:cell wall-associated NlpC family hydrolase